MSKTVSIPDRLEIDIRRPNGSIETVVHPTLKQISPRVFEQMRSATRNAGKGECLAYRQISKEVPSPQPSAADLADEKYRQSRAAIYRAMDAGEDADDVVDNTPAHKED